jgi:hypothetical protein
MGYTAHKAINVASTVELNGISTIVGVVIVAGLMIAILQRLVVDLVTGVSVQSANLVV